MKTLKHVVFILLLLFFMVSTFAQGKVSFNLGTSIPLSDFASDNTDNESALGAALGLSTGMQYNYQFSKKGFGVFGGVDLNYNGLQHDYKYEIRESIDNIDEDNEIKFYNYFNIPFTAGLSYANNSDNKVGIFLKAGYVYNIFQITDMIIEIDGITIKQIMDTGKSTGYKIGGGIIINKRSVISIEYLGTKEYEMGGTIKISGYMQTFSYMGKISLLNFSYGILF